MSDQPKNKGGRPSLYSEKLVKSICDRLSRGEPLAVICRDEGMPADRTVREWVERMPEVSAAIACAREAGEDWLAAECLTIANTPLDGEETKLDADGNVTEVKRFDMLGHRKLQIETRLKLLAKWNPRKYGDRIEVAGKLTLEQLVGASTKDE